MLFKKKINTGLTEKKATQIAICLDAIMQKKGAYPKAFLLLILIVVASVSVWIGASRAISHPVASFDFQWDAARALFLG